MPKYLFTGSYTAEGSRGVLSEGGSGRRAATEQLVASLGGTVEARKPKRCLCQSKLIAVLNGFGQPKFSCQPDALIRAVA